MKRMKRTKRRKTMKTMKRMKDDSDEDERRRGGGTAKAKIRRRGDLRLAIATTKISSKHIH